MIDPEQSLEDRDSLLWFGGRRQTRAEHRAEGRGEEGGMEGGRGRLRARYWSVPHGVGNH